MNRLLYVLAAICGALALADFLSGRHGYYAIENIPVFYGLFGFVIYVTVIFTAKALRRLILRPEDYYGRHAIDAEDEAEGPHA